MELKYSWTRLKNYKLPWNQSLSTVEKSKQDEKIRLKVERTKYQIVDKFAGSMIIASMNWEAQNQIYGLWASGQKGYRNAQNGIV